MKSNLCSRESSVFRPEFGFESTDDVCKWSFPKSASLGMLLPKGSVTHSLTLAISFFSFKTSGFFQNLCSVLVMQHGICKLSKGDANNFL